MQVVVGTNEGVSVLDGDGAAPVAAQGLSGRVVRQVVQTDGALFAAASDGVYRSTDGGRVWTRAGVDAGAVWNVAVSPADPATLLAGTQPSHLFRSTDRGASWQEVGSFLETPGAERWCVPGSDQGARTLALAVDPFDPQRIWVGVEVGGVITTADGGQRWSTSIPCGNADVHLLAAHPERPGVVFATTGYGRNDDLPMDPRLAGPYRSDDGGMSWRYLGEQMRPHYTRAFCVDPRPPYALTVPAVPDVRSSVRDPGGAQAMLFQSDDLGATWRSLGDAEHTPSAARLTAVAPDPEHPSGVLVGTETGEVWRVSPQATWTRLCTGLPAVQALLASA